MGWLLLAVAVAIGIWLSVRRRAGRRVLRSYDSPSTRRVAEEWGDAPWVGRQGRLDDDPYNRPSSAKTWNEVFNRKLPPDLRFEIEYSDDDGFVTTRVIRPTSIHLLRYETYRYIRAFCELRKEERDFRSDRIMSARNLRTNRPISDLSVYLSSIKRP